MARYVSTAPQFLIQAYTTRQIGQCRELLAPLLCSNLMKTTWRELARHVARDQQWFAVWNAIAYAYGKSKKAADNRKWRSDERDEYKNLAGQFTRLANKIETTNNPLDVLVYELFPQDVLSALNAGELNYIGPLERSYIAHRLLPCWPSTSELLHGMAAKAQALADEAIMKPRPDVRKRGGIKERVFAWHLGGRFQELFGKPMLGTVASITAKVFPASRTAITKSWVQGVMRRGYR